ncbi:MAG: hypothetical protein IJO71_12765 [Microbacterium sp.]|uniref:hypothetical protein n=1 Tax=Microbacterium sp. TaxID=51671 RepID=UPI0025EF3F79|nr:hypothetical protein [Microbacterium sp.]MBQ9918055.1 hypothetical protein [Microbacterium sp.]
MTGDAEAKNLNHQRAVLGWKAFRALAEWVWIGNLPRYLDEDGHFELEKQFIGFGSSNLTDVFWKIAQSFTEDRLQIDHLTDLLEIALEEQLGEYGLGLKPTYVSSGFESITVLHFYRVAEDPRRVAARTPQKSKDRQVLSDAGLL